MINTPNNILNDYIEFIYADRDPENILRIYLKLRLRRYVIFYLFYFLFPIIQLELANEYLLTYGYLIQGIDGGARQGQSMGSSLVTDRTEIII